MNKRRPALAVASVGVASVGILILALNPREHLHLGSPSSIVEARSPRFSEKENAILTATLAGTVTHHGHGAAQAAIHIVVVIEGSGENAGDTLLYTNNDGSFSAQLPRAQIRVVVSAAGLQPIQDSFDLRRQDDLARAARLEVDLDDCHAVLTGTVTGRHDIPVPEVVVAMAGFAVATTDQVGRYLACLPETRTATLSFAADSYGQLSVEVEVAPTVRRDVKLYAETIITGRVVGDGGVDAGLMVTATPMDYSGIRGTAASGVIDNNGVFILKGLAAGRFKLTVGGIGVLMAASVVVDTAPSQAIEDVVLTIVSSRKMFGIVETAGGRRLENVGVRCGERVGRTNDAGEFECYVRQLDLVTLTDIERSRRLDEPDGRIRFVVEDLPSLQGTVALEGVGTRAKVFVAGPRNSTILSSINGEFRIDGLVAGSYRVWARSYSGRQTSASMRVEVPMENTVLLNLRGSLSIHGDVYTDAGIPVKHVDVVAFNDETSENATTDDLGSYVIYRLTPGEYSVSIVGRPQSTVMASAGNSNGARLHVSAEVHQMAGTVIDAEGAPLENVVVTASAANNGYPGSYRDVVVSDAAGRFAFHDVLAGEYALSLQSLGAAPSTMSVRSGEALRVRLVESGIVYGRLRGCSANMRVSAGASVGARQQWIGAKVDGQTYEFRSLRPGRYVLKAVGGHDVAVQADVRVTMGTAVDVDLECLPRRTYTARLVDTSGAAGATALCRIALTIDGVPVEDWELDMPLQVADQAGVVVFADLPDATATVDCEMGTARARFQVRNDSLPEVLLEDP